MINKLTDAISIAIDAEFNTTPGRYLIYTEHAEQELTKPCFSVMCLKPTIELFRGNRYYRTNKFIILYFPSTTAARSECNAVMERLFNCLELISIIGDPIRGTKMKGKIVNGVLNFFVNYDMYVYKIGTAEDSMGTLTINSDAKG